MWIKWVACNKKADLRWKQKKKFACIKWRVKMLGLKWRFRQWDSGRTERNVRFASWLVCNRNDLHKVNYTINAKRVQIEGFSPTLERWTFPIPISFRLKDPNEKQFYWFLMTMANMGRPKTRSFNKRAVCIVSFFFKWSNCDIYSKFWQYSVICIQEIHFRYLSIQRWYNFRVDTCKNHSSGWLFRKFFCFNEISVFLFDPISMARYFSIKLGTIDFKLRVCTFSLFYFCFLDRINMFVANRQNFSRSEL